MKNTWKRMLSFLAAAAVMFAFASAPVSADTVVGVGPDGSAGQQSQSAGPQSAGPGAGTAQNTAGTPAAQNSAGPSAEQSSAGAQGAASSGAAASYDNSFALSANYAMFFHNTGWGNWSPDNQRVYRTSTYPTAFKAVLAGAQPATVSGTIQYQVNVSGTGWSAVAENGQPAGNEGGTAPLEAVRVWLNGDLASGFDVYTMVMTGGQWGNWVMNGQDAGETGTLSVSADSTVNGTIEAETTETLDDGTVIYTNATVTAA